MAVKGFGGNTGSFFIDKEHNIVYICIYTYIHKTVHQRKYEVKAWNRQ